jgi:hypothetical protein
MIKTTYPIPQGCTSVTIEQDGETVIVKFETEPKVERWRAEYREPYVFILDGELRRDYENGDELDDYRYNSGNYFQFVDDAQAELDRRIKKYESINKIV